MGLLLLQLSKCPGVALHSRVHKLFWLECQTSRGQRKGREVSGKRFEPVARSSLLHPRRCNSLVPCVPLRQFTIPPHLLRRSWTTTVNLANYSSSTDSKQATQQEVDSKDLQSTETKQSPTRIPTEDVKRILQLAHPERLRLSAAVGFLMVSSAVTMSAPFFLGQVIDTIYTSSSEDFSASLRSLCIMLSGVFLCGGAANAARVYLMQISGQQIVRNLRVFLFSSILRQEVGFFDKTRTGELINRLSADTALIGRSVTDNLSDGLRAVAQATAGVSMMFYVSPSLAAFVLLIVPPMAGLAVIYGRYLRSISKRTQDSLAEATQLAEERISNMRTVRAFGKELTEVAKYTEKANYVLHLAKQEAVLRAGFFGAVSIQQFNVAQCSLKRNGVVVNIFSVNVS